MSYLDRLKETIAENVPPDLPPQPPEPSFSGFSGDPGGPFSLRPTLTAWQDGLNALDPHQPLHGLDAPRWRQLLDDAMWLAERFAAPAARAGWSSADMFGMWPGKTGWGGLADRLQGSRSLVMDDRRARWRIMLTQEADQFVRGTYPLLSPLWLTPGEAR